ncbi:DUF3644 domain-containing protein [Naumannella halotolerans]|uniref:Uncharacterized protein DUF3644 n=1 Tax=Naumannella halotolerans TaxID=993414 RepID=A0A4R7J6X3_9ACTN|nr:DUF3644 domain-containing protein [Naumannella halotolerans]TDT33162.1 uncharacterized protein DUF3644 [Naumannella halotolerans]
MAQPYVSSRRLVANSLSAMLSAIEVYNKPRMEYRDEVTVVLIVNAWELALKAALKQAKKRVFYRKKTGQPYRTLAVEDALKQALNHNLFPPGVDGTAVAANVSALVEYRNRAVHLYAADLGEMVYPFMQTSVLNYRDYMLDRFNKDLADSITWQLLPLGARTPSEPIQFMKADPSKSAVAEVREFIDGLRRLLDEAQAAGGDMQRVASVYDVHLRSTKTVTSRDLEVAVANDGEKVVVRKADPNQTHPYSATELLQRVNAKRAGRELNSRDHQALCWKEHLRDDPRMAWKHGNAATHVWSGDAVNHMAKLEDGYYDQVRSEYNAYLQSKRV